MKHRLAFTKVVGRKRLSDLLIEDIFTHACGLLTKSYILFRLCHFQNILFTHSYIHCGVSCDTQNIGLVMRQLLVTNIFIVLDVFCFSNSLALRKCGRDFKCVIFIPYLGIWYVDHFRQVKESHALSLQACWHWFWNSCFHHTIPN